MLKTTQDAYYSTGGMLKITFDVNYFPREMLKTNHAAYNSTGGML